MNDSIRLHGAVLHISGTETLIHPVGDHLRGNLMVWARYDHQEPIDPPFLLVAFSDSTHKDSKIRELKTGKPLDAHQILSKRLTKDYLLWRSMHTERLPGTPMPTMENTAPKTYAQEDASNELYD